MGWDFTEIRVDQCSPEWFAARAGRLTGSEADKLYVKGKTKGQESVQRRDYCVRLALEQVVGQSLEDDFEKSWVQRGKEVEPVARAALEAHRGYLIDQVGFLSCDKVMAGCSLDGHVDGYEGIVELKCPKSAAHLRYIREGVLPKEYVAQVRHNLLVSGASWCDFASFDPRFPEHLRLFIVRVEAAAIAADLLDYARRANEFLLSVNAEAEAVRQLGMKA